MSGSSGGHRLVGHTGDMALLVWASSLPGLYDEATRALFDVILDVRTVEPARALPVEVDGAIDPDDLFVRFLAELLFLHDARGWVLRRFTVGTIDDHSVRGEAAGEIFDPSRHAALRQIKAVTYHRAAVRRKGSRWTGRLVLDL